MSKEDINLVTVGLQEGLHDLLALLTGELTGLAGQDIVLGCIRGSSHLILKALLTAIGNGGTNRALQDYHLELIRAATGLLVLLGHVLINPLEDVLALGEGVRANLRHIEAVVGQLHIPVNHDDRDLGILGFLQHRIPARLHDRHESNDVNALGDKGADSLDLVLLLLLCIRELQLDTGLLCRLFDGFGVGRPPFGFRSDLGEAHRDLLAAGACCTRAGRSLVTAAAAAGCHDHHHDCQQHCQNLFHGLFLSFSKDTEIITHDLPVLGISPPSMGPHRNLHEHTNC